MPREKIPISVRAVFVASADATVLTCITKPTKRLLLVLVLHETDEIPIGSKIGVVEGHAYKTLPLGECGLGESA